MKIMLTQWDGLPGRAIRAALTRQGHQVSPLSLTWDEDPEAVGNALREAGAELVIHTLPYMDADRAETEPEVCMARNAGGTLTLARGADLAGAALLLLSHVSVFGEGDGSPHRPDERPDPRSVLGLSALQAEEAVRGTLCRYYIVRTGWLFGEGCGGLVSLLSQGRRQHTFRAPGDWMGSPVYAPDLAEFLCALIGTEAWGIHHAANQGFCSRADLAEALCRMAGLTCMVVREESDPCPASRRPLNGRLSTEAEAAWVPPLPTWQESLLRCAAGIHPLAP